MNLKKSLFVNSLASGIGKISVILFRLVQVPILLSALGAEEYGRWLVLSSLPSWITLANLGFGNVAANEMAMAEASGNTNKARVIFSTTFALIFSLALIGSILSLTVVSFIPWQKFLSVSDNRHKELSYTVLWLCLSILFSFFIELFNGRFRAAGKTYISVWMANIRPWLELSIMIISLKYSTRFDILALSLLCSTFIYIFLVRTLSIIIVPHLNFSYSLIDSKKFPFLLKKGVAFQAFPLGNALLFQGNLLIIQYILGPTYVTIFGTARTLTRSINQGMELVNQVIWPELSILLGANNLTKAARLHRIGVTVSIVFASISIVFLFIFGRDLYNLWTNKTIQLSPKLLVLFLLPIPFNALWFTSSVVHVACNKHEGLAIRYLFSTIVAFIFCILLSYKFGIEGAAISTVISDLLLIPYVIRRSFILTNDTLKEFLKGIIHELKHIFIIALKYFQKIKMINS